MMSKHFSQLLIALCVATSLCSAQVTFGEQPNITVECHGQIRTGIVAIGGETTGTTITFDRITWELKLSETDRQRALDYNKKPVTVTGKLRRVKGQAVSVRWILDVDRLTLRDASLLKEGSNLTVSGTLRASGETSSPSGLEISAGDIAWPVDFSADPGLKDQAESLTGKPVVLRGRLERDPKAEASAKRVILQVKKLTQAE